MKKVKVGIIGTGNIGIDLLIKIQRSMSLECAMFTGRTPDSKGIKIAKDLGIRTSADSIKAIEDDPKICDIVFDATSAQAHVKHAAILGKLKKFTIDLTPSRVGKMCIPVLNLGECLDVNNVNLVTCGGQSATPIAYAIMQVHPDTKYIEVVASVSSVSAGPGTRINIDEYTQTTKDSIMVFSKVPAAKAIIILNPAEPPITMHNTIYALIENPRIQELHNAISAIAEKIREYVPGYKVTLGPLKDKDRVTTMVEVVGRGDYLPKYSGNLDIITCAAIRVAEEYAKKKLLK